MLSWKTPDEKSGNNVYCGDENGSQRIALAETGSAIHRPIELGFFCDLFAARARLLLVNCAGIHVRIDGHLFTRQGIEGEARGNFRRAHRAMIDDQILDGNQR